MSVIVRNARFAGRPSPCSLVLENGRITSISAHQLDAPAGTEDFDASGLIVTPGWIDVQLNGGFGHDFTEDPASIWAVASRLPSLGVTAFLPTIITCPLEKLSRAIETFRRGPPPGWSGAAPLGLHLEGPFLNPARRGAHNPAYVRLPDARLARDWTPANGVRMVTLAPELEGAHEVIGLLHKSGVIVSAGHTAATYEAAQAAFTAGITCATHLFNAQPALGHREPGFSGAVLDAPDVFAGLIADGIHVHPSMVSVAAACKRDRLILVTDAVSALGMPPGKYRVGDLAVDVDEFSVRLSDGTLAGSNASPERCVRNFATWTHVPLAEAAKAMSAAPARLLGLPDRGQIASGAQADLTLITTAGRVAATLVGGEILFRDPEVLQVN